MTASSIKTDVVDLIRTIVRDDMQAYGLDDVVVRAGEDHDGDPVLFIEAKYKLSDVPVDIAVSASLTNKLRDALWDVGETRFPHLHHIFDEHQAFKVRRRARA